MLSAPGPSDMIPFTTTEAIFASWAGRPHHQFCQLAGRRT
jgi:hypothetical protein